MKTGTLLFNAILAGVILVVVLALSPFSWYGDALLFAWAVGFFGYLAARLLSEFRRLREEVAALRARLDSGREAAAGVAASSNASESESASESTPAHEAATLAPVEGSAQAAAAGAPSAQARAVETQTVTTADARAEQAKASAQPSWQTPPVIQRQAAPSVQPAPSAVVAGASPGSVQQYAQALFGRLARANPLALVGIAVLVIAAALVMRYAVQAGIFPIQARLALICAVGVGLTVLGWWLRRRNRAYARVLQGGGIALFYLTLFAGFRGYHVIGPAMAFAGLLATGTVAVGLAVQQRALPLALVGVIGGFAAPLLVATGSGNHVLLFGYYALVNLVVFALAWYRSWWLLNLVGVLFTFGVLGVFRVGAYQPADLWTTDPFVLLFFAMYTAISVLHALRQPPRLKGYVSGTLVFAMPFAAFAMHASLVQDIEHAVAISAAVLGLAYWLAAWLLRRMDRGYLRLLAQAFTALGVIFLTLSIPLAFSAATTASAWAVEGAGLLWIGLRQSRKLAAYAGLLLQVLAALFYLRTLHPETAVTAILNGHFLGAVMLGVAGMASSVFLRKPQQLLDLGLSVAAVCAGWGVFWTTLAILLEVDQSVPVDWQHAAYLTAFGGLVLALQRAGQWLRWPQGGQAMAVLATVLGIGLTCTLAVVWSPLENGGWLGWPLWYALLGLALYWQDGYHPQGRVLTAAHVTMITTAVLVIGLGLDEDLGSALGGVWWQLGVGMAATLMMLLVLWQGGARYWPMRQRHDAYLQYALTGVAVLGLLWLLVVALGSDGNPAIFPYVPLFNPLDLVALALAVNLWRWLQRTHRLGLWPGYREQMLWPVALVLFLWLSSSLVRSLHWLLGTPLDWNGMMGSVQVQAGLSILWALLGCTAMVLGTRNRRREPWLAGAALVGIVVIKLFVVDLSGSDTLARIISFAGTGALLLATGYFSPLPPRRDEM